MKKKKSGRLKYEVKPGGIKKAVPAMAGRLCVYFFFPFYLFIQDRLSVRCCNVLFEDV
jgi:hypothetical protein